MDDLITWLRAQLDEREARARAATSGPWLRGLGTVVEQAEGDDPHLVAEMNVCADHEDRREADAEFIADNDPAFVLADVEAKRQIIDEHRDDEGWCLRCADPPQYDAAWHKYPCTTLRLLALPFAGRPGWREEWRL